MSASCHACGQRLPKPPKPEGPRIQPCRVCAKPVASGRRGPVRQLHRSCKPIWRKLRGAAHE